ncbi:flavin reductase family protein [Kitasatospora sp. NPDC059463]|uniref:flavin reductase family protein n=1 Tax=unclassified Kitasatospora TaxID=2633591 RepID=UPI0036AF1BF4
MNATSAAEPEPVSPEAFRGLMAEFPTGVAVVTARDADGRPWGMTCSSLCSVSTSPPTLLLCLRAESPTLAALLESGAFAVNLLHGGARQVGELFSSGDADRFDRLPWAAGDGGPHLSRHTHAIADCRVDRTVDGGSHLVVFGRVFGVTTTDGHLPLLYGRRQYGSWTGAQAAATPSPDRRALG